MADVLPESDGCWPRSEPRPCCGCLAIAGNHAFLPPLDDQYLNFYFAVDGAMFTHEQVRAAAQIVSLLRVAVVVASVPYFQLIGLM